ncbi:hypothetical protein RHGRI_007386 [Rhododendron griersonianum]|uniref:F-box domain-containing protein n=1 Tax=Rhododendron griersonianum TaxID=479676 RepID=A0AAV6KXE3_9ERIC|nr:hypothetical protein RHGRI_007386 [Rhododendron griersonianum]
MVWDESWCGVGGGGPIDQWELRWWWAGVCARLRWWSIGDVRPSSKILIHSSLFKIISNSSSFFPNLPPEMAMSTEFTKLFPNLPEELALECLTRLNYVACRVGALVYRIWRELLFSRNFFYHQKRTGFSQKAVVMVQSIWVQGEIPVYFPSYRLTIYYPDSKIWDRVDPIRSTQMGFPCSVRW